MKSLLILCATAISALAQCPVQNINLNAPIQSTASLLNSNFTCLAIGKTNIWSGNGAPGAITGNQFGDFYIDQTPSPPVSYQCFRNGGCTSVAPGNWQVYGSGIDQLTGDVTAGPGTGSQAATLANSGVSAGSCGDATHSCGLTVDAKGRITAQSNNAITASGGLGSVNCATATGSGTTTVSVTFSAGANCALITMPASGLVTVTLPTPSNVAGEFFLIFTNAADTTAPNLAYAGATAIGLPTGIAASNDVTVARMAWNSTITTWVGGSNVDASAAPLTAGQIPAAAALGPPVAATAHNTATIRACATAGTANAQTCTTTPSFTPAAGDEIIVIPGTGLTNTGAMTLNVNSTSAAAVMKWGGSAALASGDLVAGKPFTMTFDGTNWNTSDIGNAPSAGGPTSSCAGTSTGVVYQCTGTLSSAQILGMFATPVTVVTAPGTGFLLWPTLWEFQSSNTGTLYSAGGNVELKWTNGNTALFDSPLILTTFNNSLSIYGPCGGPGSTSGTCGTGDHTNGIKNTGLEITNATAAFTTGTATANYLIQYVVLPVH